MPDSSPKSAPKKLEHVVAEKTGALSPNDTVQTAGERMRSNEANAWPVAEEGKLVGLIDQANPDRQAGGHGHDPQTTRVGDTMRREVAFCYEDQDITEARRIMTERDLNHLPVVDRDMRIVGIISRSEIGDAPSESPPAEDWVPGEKPAEPVADIGMESGKKEQPSGSVMSSAEQGLPATGEHGLDGGAYSHDPGDRDEPPSAVHFDNDGSTDPDRFPFRPAPDEIEVR